MKELIKKMAMCLILALAVTGLYLGFIKPVSNKMEAVEEVTIEHKATAGINDAMIEFTAAQLKTSGVYSIKHKDVEIVKSGHGDVEDVSPAAIEVVAEIVEPEPVIEYKTKKVSKDFYIDASVLNVRSEASTDAEVVKKLAMNDEVTVTEKVTVFIDGEKQDHTWYKVDGYDGYVRSDYLSDEPVYEYLGEYRITYYCNCPKCCDKWSWTTASGATTVEGITVAADKSIPFGTKLLINNHVYTVQDRGGAIKGNHIDIYMSSHEKALAQTYLSGPVYKVP